MSDWESITPRVNESAEFLEIASDFGDPLEIFREALHNAYDWGATEFSICVSVEEISGVDKLVIELCDNGTGMSADVIKNNFWDLGNSKSKGNKDTIGEKGHGTKIYLRSDKVIVHTNDGNKSYESECEGSFAALNSGKVHSPRIKESTEQFEKGTWIRIEGYNNNERSTLSQNIIKDYLYWFTVLGTIENQLPDKTLRDFSVRLKALDVDDFEELPMGHIFAEEGKDINTLYDEYGEEAADYYVKKFVYSNRSLPSKPEIKYDVVIYYEGDEAKRLYNPMIRQRKNKSNGTYKVSDRYGIWLCKDFVPIQRTNEWITSFGLGSNSYGLLHGFINCQKLKLTANRGSIANTNNQIINELKTEVQRIIEEIDLDLYRNDVMTLRKWREEAKTQAIEEAAFEKRRDYIKKKKCFEYKNRTFLVPRNEAELYGTFMSLYTLDPDNFDFEPLDYDESVGIDLLARNKTNNKIADCEFWYVELKYQLGASLFNHSFSNLRYILCWELANKVLDGSELNTKIEGESRTFHIVPEDKKKKTPRHYYLDSDSATVKIKVVCLKEYVTDILKAKIHDQN